MTDHKDVMQQALDALLGYKPYSLTHAKEQGSAIIALRAAIAQPEQKAEPVAHSLAGFVGGFTIQYRRPPTDQEIWNHAIRSWRDLNPIAPSEQYERMFEAACIDLGLINEALGLDPDDGGAEPILEAISELKAIAHPEQTAKPVAWFEYNQDLDAWFLAYGYNPKAKTRPLFEHPAIAQPEQTNLAPGYCKNCKDYTIGQPMVAQPEQHAHQPFSYERDSALCEANCNAESDAFFTARPAQDSDANRRIFYAGHRRAWINYPTVVAAIAQPEQPAQRNLTGSELGVIHRALLRSGNVITAIAQPKDKP